MAARIVLLSPRGRDTARFDALFTAFTQAGARPEHLAWHDDEAEAAEAGIQGAHALLVWCNPIEDGRRRDRLDALLQRVAQAGVQVSAHPDAVLRLGTKDVLFETRHLPFGSDVQRVDSLAQLRAELPLRLHNGPRVLKQQRGHSGIGVWRVEALADGRLQVRHAERGSGTLHLGLDELQALLAPYFTPEAGGHMIDQPWQPRIAEGMLRAYLVGERVAGFGHQAVNALHPDQALPGPRLYHGPDWAPGQALKQGLESGWVRQLRETVGLPAQRLPLLWDCDFMQGDDGRPVLCEINVSSVSPFPPSCIAPLVAATLGGSLSQVWQGGAENR